MSTVQPGPDGEAVMAVGTEAEPAEPRLLPCAGGYRLVGLLVAFSAAVELRDADADFFFLFCLLFCPFPPFRPLSLLLFRSCTFYPPHPLPPLLLLFLSISTPHPAASSSRRAAGAH